MSSYRCKTCHGWVPILNTSYEWRNTDGVKVAVCALCFELLELSDKITTNNTGANDARTEDDAGQCTSTNAGDAAEPSGRARPDGPEEKQEENS